MVDDGDTAQVVEDTVRLGPVSRVKLPIIFAMLESCKQGCM